MYKYVNW